MGKAMGLDMKDATGKVAVSIVVEAIRELNSRLNIPQQISEVGVLKSDIPMLAEKALKDPCTPGNPREMDILEFENLFKKAL